MQNNSKKTKVTFCHFIRVNIMLKPFSQIVLAVQSGSKFLNVKNWFTSCGYEEASLTILWIMFIKFSLRRCPTQGTMLLLRNDVTCWSVLEEPPYPKFIKKRILESATVSTIIHGWMSIVVDFLSQSHFFHFFLYLSW